MSGDALATQGSLPRLVSRLREAAFAPGRLALHPWAVAIRRGFLLCLPLVLTGAFAVALGNLPLPGAMDTGIPAAWQALCARAGDATFGIISLCLCVTIAYSLANQRKTEVLAEITPLIASIVAAVCFVMVALRADGVVDTVLFGTRSVFTALLVAIAATELFLRLMRVSRLHLLHDFNDADPLLPGLLRAILPALLTVGAFLVLHQALATSGIALESLTADAVTALFQPIDSPLSRALLFNLVNQLLWFVGAHGNNILSAVEQQYLVAATAANAAAVAAGEAPAQIVTKPFLDIFVFMGGSGTVLALVIAVLIGWRGSNQHRLARLSLAPALFNVSELMVYGLPVVLNPIFLVPFVLAPLVLVLTSYAACAAGLVPLISHPVSWTTPPLVGGYIATGSWRGIALQVLNLAIAVAIYRPFVERARQLLELERRRNFAALMHAMGDIAAGGPGVTTRNDAIGSIARQLAHDLMPDTGNGRMYLVYQPQVRRDGRVVGVEALLRWNHALFGPVPPNIAVAIAEEAGLVIPLGDWVIATACARQRDWRDSGIRDVRMSINLSPTQLSDAGFVARMRAALEGNALPPDSVELEVTEGRAVAHDDATVRTMSALADMGIRLAMDDFGMGYSSLLYMRRFRIHAIKLDGSLTREVLTNTSCQEIIETIANLCANKSIRIIAEFVETEEQRDLLHRLGCGEYQGYLYSRPLPADECAAFIAARNAA